MKFLHFKKFLICLQFINLFQTILKFILFTVFLCPFFAKRQYFSKKGGIVLIRKTSRQTDLLSVTVFLTKNL